MKISSMWTSLAIVAVLLVAGFAVVGSARAGSPGTLVSPAASLGVVTIDPNGSVSNPLAPISVSAGVYHLTAPFSGALVVLASGVVVNGSGFAVNYTVGLLGGDGAAVTVANATAVTVEDFASTNATLGILVENSTYATVSGNAVAGSNIDIEVLNSTGTVVSGNHVERAGNIAIAEAGTTGGSVTGNNATGAYEGIYVIDASGVTISGNVANATANHAIDLFSSSGLLVENNYLEGGAGLFDYALAAYLVSDLSVIGNNGASTYYGFQASTCLNVVFEGNNASSTYTGVGVYGSTNVLITETAATSVSSEGVWASASTNVSEHDNFLGHDSYGIYDSNDHNLLVTGNDIPVSGALGDGIEVALSSGVLLDGNNLTGAQNVGVYLYETTAVTVSNNVVTNFTNEAVYVDASYGPTWIVNNSMSYAPTYGSAVEVYSAYGPTLVQGNVMDNAGYGIYSDSSYGSLSVVSDHISNASSDAVYLYLSYGPVTITDSVLANTSSTSIYDAYQSGGAALTIAGNDLAGAGYAGVYYDNFAYSTAALNVTDNNITHALLYGVYVYESEGAVSILGNNITHAGTDAVYLEYCDYAPTVVSGNDLSYAGYEGIYSYSGLGVTVSDNRAVNVTNTAVDLEHDAGLDLISGNDLRNAGYDAVYDYSNSFGVDITQNLLQGAVGYALDLEYSSYPSELTNNRFGGGSSVYLYGDNLATVSGNDLRDVSSVTITVSSVGQFYHNNVNSTAFTQSGNTVAGTWNAPYPIGGNYWTGYSGLDHYSGPQQTLPGSDGIGDTSYTVSGATDAYPLMTPWTSATVTFTSNGLPSGTPWSVTLNGVAQSGVGGGTIVVSQTNGADTPYSYSVASSDTRYAPSPASGTGIENGLSQVVAVSFSPVVYAVTFTETSLPAGASWSVTLAGVTQSSTSDNLTFNETNGTYAFTVGAISGFTIAPASGTVTVGGAAVDVPIAFTVSTSVSFSVQFVLSGLPSGSSWSVNLNGSSQSATSTTVTFHVSAGRYPYTVTVPSGYNVSSASGTVVVAGNGVTVYLAAYATPSTPSGTTKTGTSSTSSTEVYGLAAGLLLALVVAVIGWLLFLGRKRPGSGVPAQPPAGAAAASAPPSGGPTGPTPPP